MSQLHFSKALLADGWHRDVLLTLREGIITTIATETLAPPTAQRVSGIAIPGLPNVHSHAFQRAVAGRTERHGPADDSFWTWREVMYAFLAQMTPDDIEAVAAMAYVEMLEAGFTAVGEFHYLHNAPDGSRYADPAETAGRIVAAAQTAGIGLTLLPCFYAHGGCGGKPSKPGQLRFLSELDGFLRLVEGSRRHAAAYAGTQVGIAPHSLRAVAAAELRALVESFPDGPLHIHAAEQALEVEECLAWSGARPVQWLLDHMPVDRRWCLIHCTHMTHDEIRRLAASGATAGLCPITEANLGDGIFPAVDFTAAAGRFAVGTDSNVRIAANEELRTLEYSQRLRDQKRNRLGSTSGSTGRFVFDTACKAGAQALNRGSGQIAVGQPAEIVVLDVDQAALVHQTEDAVLDAWIFASGSVIREVFVTGQQVVTGGTHHSSEIIRRRYAQTVKRLLSRS